MSSKKVLIIGSGGREHAIALSLSNSPIVDKLYIAPGNAGTAQLGQNIPINATDIDLIFHFAKEKGIDLTVVGPEAPLAVGIVDMFEAEGMHIFGPGKAAASIEVSKIFAIELMESAGVPTAKSETFTDYTAAADFIKNTPYKVVIKADGLAAGKGVYVTDNDQEALEAAYDILENKRFGIAGETIIIEERLEGEEASILAFSDGERVLTMLPSQDHKRIGEGDSGPNTGGMGAYAPAPVISADDIADIESQILLPVIKKLADRGTPYRGVLYAGLMVTADGFKVLEFNCRFGDPETQAVLPLLKDDLFKLCMGCATGKLPTDKLTWHSGAAVAVVVASGGYPGDYEKGYQITGLDTLKKRDDVIVYYAGVEADAGHLLSNGGRVLAITGLGDNIESARDIAYGAIGEIHFTDMYYRRDIAARALK